MAFASKKLARPTVVRREAAGGKLQLLEAKEGQKDELHLLLVGRLGQMVSNEAMGFEQCRIQPDGVHTQQQCSEGLEVRV